MAKESKARVRVFFGEIEGDNETIRDGLRSIASAVNKTFQTGPTIVKILEVENGTPDEKVIEHVEGHINAESVTDEAVIDTPSPVKAAPRRKKASRPLALVKNLNLRPEGKESLRDFYGSRGPVGQNQQLTVILYYLHRILETPKVTYNHVYTGLKEVEAKVPANLPQAFHNIANRKGWVDSSDGDDLKTTIQGDNLVEQDLKPRKNLVMEDQEA